MSALYQQTLFRINSNQTVGSWHIEVVDNTNDTADVITTQTKVLGGKGVESKTTVAEGKNAGKKNETNALQQAVLNAKSTADKKLKKGYLKDIPSGDEQVTNSLGLLKPMLAQSIDKVTSWHYPVYASPKLDGHRLLAAVQNDDVILYSREGSEVTLPHIKAALQTLYHDKLWSGTTLDGEVYLHGESLHTITSLVKKSQSQSESLMYVIYDVLDTQKPYEQRLDYINALAVSEIDCLSLIDTQLLDSIEKIDLFHSHNLAYGYEGTMLRWSDAGYEDGKRSKSLMKKKDFQDAEFTVVDVTQGKSVTRNGKAYELPVYVCETAQGTPFNCVAAGSLQEKHQAWLNKDQAIGKQLTVKFFNYTDNNIPFLPVAIGLRSDI